jgi:hypothetical protein
MTDTLEVTKERKPVSKKKRVLVEIFAHCENANNYTFDNALVQQIATNQGFGNAYDVTKIDNSSILPDEISKKGYCVAHLGEGKHKFIKAAEHWFHEFEKIETEEIVWPYRKSVLNETDTSESNILSVGFNQRIIHDFLYEDIVASPKMYGARRTKYTGSYSVGGGGETLTCTKLQMEIDLTTEHLGAITVFEGKNKFPKDFSVYQIYHPFLYFQKLHDNKQIVAKEINCCYLRRGIVGGDSVIRLHLYTFTDPTNIASLKILKNAQYRLVKR